MATNTNVNVTINCDNLPETMAIIEYLKGEGLLAPSKARKKKDPVEAVDAAPNTAPAATVAPVAVPPGQPVAPAFVPPVQPQVVPNPAAGFGPAAGGANLFPNPAQAVPNPATAPQPLTPQSVPPAPIDPLGNATPTIPGMTLDLLTVEATKLVNAVGAGPLSGMLISKFKVQTLKELNPGQFTAAALEIQLLLSQAGQ